MDLMDGETEVRDYALERQMMLTDGVYAIAMTLLALELRAPGNWDHTVAGLFRAEWPGLVAYGLSFAVIAIMWASQRQMSARLLRTDFVSSLFALLGLGFITLIPFSAKLYAEALAGDAPGQAPALYLGVLTGAALGNALCWGWSAVKPGLIRPEVGLKVRWTVFLVLLLMPPAMSAVGVYAYGPGLHWLPLLMAPLSALAGAARRWAAHTDGEVAPRGRGGTRRSARPA